MHFDQEQNITLVSNAKATKAFVVFDVGFGLIINTINNTYMYADRYHKCKAKGLSLNRKKFIHCFCVGSIN